MTSSWNSLNTMWQDNRRKTQWYQGRVTGMSEPRTNQLFLSHPTYLLFALKPKGRGGSEARHIFVYPVHLVALHR